MYDIAVINPDFPGSLRGWFWTCACDECRDKAERDCYGPYKTKRRAERAGSKGERFNARCVVTFEGSSKDPGAEAAWSGRIKTVRARTAELAQRLSAEAGFADLKEGTAH
jgi:hypothetical protein